MGKTIVVEIGLDLVKVGYAGDDALKKTFPMIVGRNKHGGKAFMGQEDTYVGDGADERRDVLFIFHVVKGGKVADWDDYAKILHYALYNSLQTEREALPEHPFLLIDSLLSNKTTRTKMAEIMFDDFCLSAIIISSQSENDGAWAVGSKKASNGNFKDTMMTYEEYEEKGASFVNEK